jgi:transketolase
VTEKLKTDIEVTVTPKASANNCSMRAGFRECWRSKPWCPIISCGTSATLGCSGPSSFIFSDYARPAIRLSALMEIPSIFIFTHDAMGDGEDGPTHQPVEQLLSLRAIPGLVTLRPGDANEVVEAYRYVMQLHHEPAVLALSRQPLPTLDRTKYAPAAGVAKGAYVLADSPTRIQN